MMKVCDYDENSLKILRVEIMASQDDQNSRHSVYLNLSFYSQLDFLYSIFGRNAPEIINWNGPEIIDRNSFLIMNRNLNTAYKNMNFLEWNTFMHVMEFVESNFELSYFFNWETKTTEVSLGSCYSEIPRICTLHYTKFKIPVQWVEDWCVPKRIPSMEAFFHEISTNQFQDDEWF